MLSTNNSKSKQVPSDLPPSYAMQQQLASATAMKQQTFDPSTKIHNPWTNESFFSLLQAATSFHVKQETGVAEVLLGQANEYTVKDQAGHDLFYVDEESDMCVRICFKKERGFTLTTKDLVGREVMVMDRPLDLSCCCGLVWADTMTVSAPNGQLLGIVRQKFDLLHPKLDILDGHGRLALKVKGPLCPISFGPCFKPVKFKLLTKAGVEVGHISKHWSGLCRELFTEADYFSISFPVDLDPSIKAVCLAALFLIDFEYFE